MIKPNSNAASNSEGCWMTKWIGILLLLPMSAANFSLAQTSEEGNPLRKPAAEATDLAATQERLAGRFDRLEMLAGRLAELSRATQPRRAKLLQELITKSRQQGVEGQFEQVLEALQQESLGSASQLQGELQLELKQLLELLLREDRERQIESERKRIRKYLAELNQLIRMQRGVRARTEGGDDAKRLAKDQQRVAEGTEKLGKQGAVSRGSSRSKSPVTANPVMENLVMGNPVMGNPVTGNPVTGNPVTGNPVTGNPVTGNPVTGNQT